MSRLGKIPIPLLKGVELKPGKNGIIDIKGPKGDFRLEIPVGISLRIEGNQIYMERDETLVESEALSGLYRSLLKNAIIGVSEGFEIRLSLVGVGYRANVAGTRLDMQLGYSHPTFLEIPKNIQVVVDKGVAISIKGIDKREVGQFAAAVRAMKPPEPYKGKGVRYENEYVRKKEGKAAKGKA